MSTEERQWYFDRYVKEKEREREEERKAQQRSKFKG